MARIARVVAPGFPHHVTQRDNRRQQTFFCYDCFEEVRKSAHLRSRRFHFPTDTWLQILYELAATFHTRSVNRDRLIDLTTPLYYARVATFVR